MLLFLSSAIITTEYVLFSWESTNYTNTYVRTKILSVTKHCTSWELMGAGLCMHRLVLDKRSTCKQFIAYLRIYVRSQWFKILKPTINPYSCCTNWPVDISHNTAAPSLPDDKMYLLLFENRTVQTGAPSWALAYVEVQRLLIPSQTCKTLNAWYTVYRSWLESLQYLNRSILTAATVHPSIWRVVYLQ